MLLMITSPTVVTKHPLLVHGLATYAFNLALVARRWRAISKGIEIYDTHDIVEVLEP